MTRQELAKQIFDLEKKKKEIDFELEFLKSKAKKIGTFETQEFIVSVNRIARENVSMPKIKAFYGDNWRKVMSRFVKQSDFQAVSVKRKVA